MSNSCAYRLKHPEGRWGVPLLLSALLVACGGGAPAPVSIDGEVSSASDVPADLTPVPPPTNPDDPGVRQVGPGRYEAVIYASNAGFDPVEIEVPVGAEVHFRFRSRDQPHGYMIEGTPVAVDVFPEFFTEGTHTFSEPGEYRVICHVYCGGGTHEAMQGTVMVVEPEGG